jgi:hypothetical protein
MDMTSYKATTDGEAIVDQGLQITATHNTIDGWLITDLLGVILGSASFEAVNVCV